MFGAHAIYVRGKIVLILRESDKSVKDNGVWLATTGEHHESLKKDFPSMRSISIFGPGPTGWQVLPMEAEDFEESALKVCDFVRNGDPRIGKIPKGRSKTKKKKKKKEKKKTRKKLAKKKVSRRR